MLTVNGYVTAYQHRKPSRVPRPRLYTLEEFCDEQGLSYKDFQQEHIHHDDRAPVVVHARSVARRYYVKADLLAFAKRHSFLTTDKKSATM